MAVYFAISAKTGLVKIGTSRNVKKRLKALESIEGAKLFLIRQIHGSYPEEYWVHHKFKDSRILGEWFEYCSDMMTFQIPDNIDDDVAEMKMDAISAQSYVSLTDQEFSEIQTRAEYLGFKGAGDFIRYSAIKLATKKGFWP